MLAIAHVALSVPLYGHFDYLYDRACPPVVGGRVEVPFGSRQMIGVVVGLGNHSDVAVDKLRALSQVIDDTPIFDEWLLKLAKWLSGYYHYPLGETLFVMLPVLLRQGKDAPTSSVVWQVVDDLDFSTVKTALKTAKKQQAHWQIIANNPKQSTASLLRLGVSGQSLTALANKGLITSAPLTHKPATTLNAPHLMLNDEQKSALDTISQTLHDGVYRGILLYGVTGSGKTEVYLQAMHTTLSMGKQVLLLVPEIGLTPQSQARFEQRFCANIVVLHSGLNDNERLLGYQACKDGTADIIIATRSSLFYPFKNLGLIVIDEAHDLSFKQQDHLRYHACDVALYVGFCQKIPVVLGTATPSLEQLKLVADGKLTQCTLSKRAGGAVQASFELVDMRLGSTSQMSHDGSLQDTHLSPMSIVAMRETLERGEQVMVFINRRGFAPIMLCEACGWQADCVRCSSHLTVYKTKKPYLKCHHCAYQISLPAHCPACHSANLITLGQGTSGVFDKLHAIFANPQTSRQIYPIVQIDRDTVSGKGAWDKIYAQINTGEPMILVGTQMIAKGHHFDKVTLVVVVDADGGFLSPNFRSPEHTAQTIMQVAGRAGRAMRAGRVLLQTYTPDSRHLVQLVGQGYDVFARTLLSERRQLGLPPYSHAVLIQAEHYRRDVAKNAIIHAKRLLDTSPFSPHSFAVLAPVDAPMAKKNNRYCVQMLILSKQRKSLHDMLDDWWLLVLDLPSIKGVRLVLEVDPMGW